MTGATQGALQQFCNIPQILVGRYADGSLSASKRGGGSLPQHLTLCEGYCPLHSLPLT
jgi:hypothetical protein